MLADNQRVARALGLIEAFGGDADAGGSAAAADEREAALVGTAAEEERDTDLPNCFLSRARPCYYPTYPTVEFLGKCVPVPPTDLRAAQVSNVQGPFDLKNASSRLF